MRRDISLGVEGFVGVQHLIDDSEEFAGGGHQGNLFPFSLGNPVVESGEVGVVFDVGVDALDEDPAEPAASLFDDVPMVEFVSGLVGGGDQTGIGTEPM